MVDTAESEKPKSLLATQDWVLRELMDTERRIERAFHEQTVFINQKMDSMLRWLIGLMVSGIIAILVAIVAS